MRHIYKQNQGVQLQQLEQSFEQLVLQVHQKMDEHPHAAWSAVIFLAVFIIWKRLGRQGRRAMVSGSRVSGLLAQTLFMWSPYDALTIDGLLRSIAIFGASGSGKTSGSGYQLAKAIVGNRKIGGLILASKPEDLAFWQGIFKKAGRKHDLLIFSPQSSKRLNFAGYMQQCGADTREITEAFLTIGETVQQLKNDGQQNEFWRPQKERTIYNAIEIVRQATGGISAPNIQKFLSGAAQTPEELRSEAWQKGFHNKCLEAAYNRSKTTIQRHDFELALDFWHNEYPSMAQKTRSGIVADIMGALHVWNTGQVRELMSTDTNISPAVFDQGKWVLVDMPISSYGASGAFVIGAWKYLTQWHILRRHATEKTPVCVIWADEAQKVLNSKDVAFLAECRSHRGCMVYLTQSLHSYYARLGRGAEHEADALLTNFYHKIFHAVGDDKTAAFGSGLVGRRVITRMGGSMGAGESVGEELYGKGNRYSANFNESIENVLENREFMQGLRTGGWKNGYVVDGIVIRSGEAFSNGEAWLRVTFRQN